MASSQATVGTASGSRYLQQLAKHWSHRFEVRFDRQSGHIDFGDGQTVDLSADAAALHVTVTDRDASRLEELERVVADHLKRFAFRENLEFDWRRGDRA